LHPAIQSWLLSSADNNVELDYFMFNQFSSAFVQRLIGRKPAALLGEFSGTTERTWRKRLQQGWKPTDDQSRDLDKRLTAALTEQLIKIGGWSIDEASDIIAGQPSSTSGHFLPTADLIYHFSPLYGKYCQETMRLASHFDHDCERLADAVQQQDVNRARAVLTAMLDWLQTFCVEKSDMEDAEALRIKLGLSCDVATLLKDAEPLHEALILHVLSCWDVEFCAGYFDSTMQAYPLFQLVMPRFAPDITVEQRTLRLLRNGQPPRRNILETASSRFIDFLSVLVAWRRYRRLPHGIPRVKDFAAWCKESETRLVSWRDETTRLTARQLEQIWTTALTPDSQGIYPAIPSPMLVCTHIWSPLLLRGENHRPSGLIDCTAGYKMWWDRNYHRLTGQGLQFGMQAWPDYLLSQPFEGESPVSIFSSPSSGR
jgi:hypothetical protein